MHDSTSATSAHPSPPGTPAPGESERRERFQAAHPEVGFALRLRCEKRWVAYWLAEDGKPRHVTGETLGEVLDGVAEEFG